MTRTLLLSATALLLLAGCGEKTDKPGAEKGGETAVAKAGGDEDTGVPPLGPDGLPRFKPGLWQVVKTDSASKEGPETTRDCIGAEANKEVRELFNAPASPGCKKTTSKGIGGIMVAQDCEQSGMKVRSAISLAGSDTRYTMKIDMRITTPDGKTDGGVITGKARWIGACPAGMKPGDSTDVGGGDAE